MRLFLVLLPSLLFASFLRATQSSGTANKTREVQGAVIEATSNEPIRKALVILRSGEDPGVGTYTDDAGRFALREVNPGTYLISAERIGFATDPKTRWQSVSVSTSDAGEPIILKLHRTGAISGHIVDTNGEPVTGASIQLQPSNPKKSRSADVVYAGTDDRGNYRAYNIQPGKYKMSVTYSSRRGDQRVKIQMEKDKTKDASPDAYGTAYYPGTLDAGQATTIQVDPGADLQGIDIALRHTKTVRVQGKVSSADGDLLAPVMVILTPLNGSDSISAQVGADGGFELAEVSPGKYSVAAIELLLQRERLTGNQPLDVGETDIDGVQLTFLRAQTVTGVVLMPTDRKLPTGLVVVLRSKEQSSPHVGGQPGGFAQLTERGTFSLENVLPGDYDLVVGNVGNGDDLYVAGIRSGDQDLLASGLHVGNSAPPPIEFVLKANGAAIDCTVLDDKQTPIPEARVTLLPDPPRAAQNALRGECRTNASGKCTLLGIAPGDYHVFAIAGDDSADFSDPANIESLQKVGKAVTVAQGDRKSMQIGVVQLDNQQ